MKLLHCLLISGVLAAPIAAAAQTPRDRVLDQLNLNGAISSAPTTKAEPDVQPVLDQDPTSEPIPEPAPELVSDLILEPAIEVLPDPKQEPVQAPEPTTVMPAKTSGPASFYLSAKEYRDLRGAATGPRAVYKYRITTENEAKETRVRTLTLKIGQDYAAIDTGTAVKIYDFKMDRLLMVTPYFLPGNAEATVRQFDNVSLYAKVLRNISTVRGATGNGAKNKVQIGLDTFIDKFWIESAMSWAAAPPETQLEQNLSGKNLTVMRGGAEIFTAEFDTKPYADTALKNSFLLYAHHDLSIHPLILKTLYEADAPIKHMEITEFGPNAPEGQKQIWTLSARSYGDAGFPLPTDALSVAERKPVQPLVFMIDRAARGKALGGAQSLKDLQAEFDEFMQTENYPQAWLMGQQFLARSGLDCAEQPEHKVCEGVSAYEGGEHGGQTHIMQRYFMAVALAGNTDAQSRIELIEAVRPNLDDDSAPAFIYRLAAMARAKLTTAQASAAGIGSVSAQDLLMKAMAKDPYDPKTYIGLGQVLAAGGEFEASWDVYDALRSGIDGPDQLSVKINRFEQKLRKIAPGYFLFTR